MRGTGRVIAFFFGIVLLLRGTRELIYAAKERKNDRILWSFVAIGLVELAGGMFFLLLCFADIFSSD